MSGITIDVNENDIVDSLNSTESTLLANQTFTGSFVDVTEFASIQICVVSDQASALDGAIVQFSTDGTISGIIRSHESTIQPSTYGLFFSLPREAAYYRVIYTNGDTDQTTFKLQSLLSTSNAGSWYTPLGGKVTDTSTAQIIKAANIGQQPDGDWVTLRATGVSFEYSTEKADSPDPVLIASEELDTGWLDTDGWASIEIYITSDVVSIEDGIQIQRTIDTSAIPVLQSGQSEFHTYTSQDVINGFKVIRIPAVLDGFKMIYSNGLTDQTSFEVVITNQITSAEPPSSQLTDELNAGNRATTTKASIIAPDDNNSFENVGRNGEGVNALNIYLKDISAALGMKPYDAFETGQINVNGNTPVLVPPSTIANPSKLMLQNTDPIDDVYYGNSASVTELTGYRIKNDQEATLNIDATPQVWLIAQSGGGETNILNLDANNVDSNTGVTDPGNMFASDDTRAIFDSLSDTCEVSSFPGSSSITLANITSVKIKAEMRKESGAPNEVSAFSQSVSDFVDNPVTITSPTVTAASNLIYIIYVSRRDIGADVIDVTNTMGLSGFSIIADVQNNDESRTTAIIMTGTAIADGTISVTFDTAADYGCIGVLSFSNVNEMSPIHDFDTDFGNDDNTLDGNVNVLENGMVIMGAGAELSSVSSRLAGFTNRITNIGSTANNDQILDVSTMPITTTGSQFWSMGFDSTTADTSGIAVSLTPSDALNPVLLVGYEVSGVPGATSMSQAVSSLTDATFEQEITSDRAWTELDIDNTSLVPSIGVMGNANLEIDRLWLEVIESGSKAVVSYRYEGNN